MVVLSRPSFSHIMLVAACLFITFLLAADALWLPYREVPEVYSHDYPERTRTTSTRSYYSYILQTTAGKEYLIPMPVRGYILHKDTLRVGYSYIFNKPSEISWCNQEGKCYRIGISLLHNNVFFYSFTGSVIIFSFLTLVPLRFGRQGAFPYLYLLLTIVTVAVLYYFLLSFN